MNTATTKQALARLKELDREARLLEHVSALLGWDQETNLPEGAVEGRASQQALIQGLLHERITDPEIGELLERAGAPKYGAPEDGTEGTRPSAREPDLDFAFLRAKARQYALNTRLPVDFVTEFAELTSKAQAVWAQARKNNDFSLYQPYLEKVVAMNIRRADYFGYEEHPYDALLDQYEPYMRASQVKTVFDELQTGLVSLKDRIAAAPQVDDSFMHRNYPLDKQEEVGRRIMTAIGYDTDRGRLDVSSHPFTTTLGGDDVRITTRYHEDFLQSSIFSTMHETGHALYEQGIANRLKGTLLADGTTLGIHESQSRFWENTIGRSRRFWEHWLPYLKTVFPDQLGDVTVDRFYRAVNRVEPTFIRVEADEVTYGLHVILRFRMELALISGELKVADAPAAWNDLSSELLGIVPKSDRDGILQDVHWSFGGIGYFPTYALGNLYCAQFTEVMERDIPDLWDLVSAGDTAPILSWLRKNIHRWGSVMSASELVRRITGHSLSPGPFLRYLEKKYGEIYSL